MQDDHINLTKICRACMSAVENLKQVDEDKDSNFLITYKTCTSVDLTDITDLPLQFCESCLVRLEDFNSFREMCLQSHANVQTMLKMLNKAEDEDINEEIVIFNNNHLQVLKIEYVNSQEEEREFPEETNCKIKSEVLKCPICRETFADENILQQHFEASHCTTDYKCVPCGEMFVNPLVLAEHVKSYHKPESNSKSFGCGRCEKAYTSLGNLQVHVYSHLGLRPFKCEYCPKDFTKQTTLSAHLDRHRGICNFLCTKCGKAFSSAPLLRRHESVHTGFRPFLCKLCPSKFVVNKELVTHMRTHTGEKPYLCSTCGKGFSRINHLNVHKRTHTGEKPYKCSFCDKCFAQSGDWKIHERTHTGEKPYACEVCLKRFNQSSGLTAHMKTSHRVRQTVHQCEFCARIFTREGNLKNHLYCHK